MARRKREQWEIDLDAREDALKAFKKNFKQQDEPFAAAVKELCDAKEIADEPFIQNVAAIMLSDKKRFAARLEYLSVMTSEENLGRRKTLPRAINDEGRWKLRGVLGIVLGP